ncbi:MAG: hypothetical protein ACPG5B_14025 [Chitinophagales bacterium]
MKFTPFIFAFLSLSLFTNCGETLSSTTEKSPNAYFSLKDFFEKEMTQLADNKVSLHKTVFLDEESETKDLSTVDWKNELSLFADADINKAAWKDKYEVDSTRQATVLEVSYVAKDEDLRTQKVALKIDNTTQAVTEVLISKKVKNVVYEIDEELQYIVDKSYSIAATQTVLMTGTEVFKVEGSFNRLARTKKQ